ncbi:transposase [Streptomyces sp. NPDC001296]
MHHGNPRRADSRTSRCPTGLGRLSPLHGAGRDRGPVVETGDTRTAACRMHYEFLAEGRPATRRRVLSREELLVRVRARTSPTRPARSEPHCGVRPAGAAGAGLGRQRLHRPPQRLDHPAPRTRPRHRPPQRRCRRLQVLARRWVVERSFARLPHSQRLVRDYERRTDVSETVILWSITRLMSRRLAAPTSSVVSRQ